MKKQYSLLGYVIIPVLALLVLGSNAQADFIQSLQADRAQVEKKLGLDPQWNRIPHATSYYDDMVDHYEKDQIMSDQIGEGIR